jgi:peroxiredoxin
MKKIFCLQLPVAMLLLVVLPVLAVAAQPPAVGAMLPAFTLPAPKDAAARSYLHTSGSFAIPGLKADVVILEIFSAYCPYCQAEAPAVNALYAKIEQDRRLRDRIKLIGVGAGNTPFEVDLFRKKYDIPFPLFPDEDFSLHKLLGEVRTPYFVAVKIAADGTHRVIVSRLGRMSSPDEFLASIVNLGGLK